MTDDNARKFISEEIDQEFLRQHGATSSQLVIDWTDIGEDSESKIVRETSNDGTVQFLSIVKKIQNGTRTSEKMKIDEKKYNELLHSSIKHKHIEKARYRFDFCQNGNSFSLRYDEFLWQKFMLEVDASDSEALKLFHPETFPYALQEVTGDQNYYGYRFGA